MIACLHNDYSYHTQNITMKRNWWLICETRSNDISQTTFEENSSNENSLLLTDINWTFTVSPARHVTHISSFKKGIKI